MFIYVKDEIVSEIRNDFLNFLGYQNYPYKGDIEFQHKYNLRENILLFFESSKFQKNYKKLALSLGFKCNLKSEELIYQPKPTPRIYAPGGHGTDWHCDYWYGHGETFYTAWLPMIGITSGATFQMLHQDNSDIIFDRYEKNPQLFKEKFSIHESEYFDVLPDENSLALFDSRHIHGSLLNSSEVLRISFDFRLGSINDKTSTKNLFTYHGASNKSKDFRFRKTLKYICGGRAIDTIAQIVLIENFNQTYFNIGGQEAEIERYGQPMLIKYATEIANKTSQFDSIAIASVNLIDEENLQHLLKIKSKIFCCLEGKHLKDLI